MKKFKKLFATALVCVMALTLLTACGKKASAYVSEVKAKLGTSVTITGTETDTKAATATADKLTKQIKVSTVTKALETVSNGDENAVKTLAETYLKNAGLKTEDIYTGEDSTGKTVLYAYASGLGQKGAVSSADTELNTKYSDASTYFAEQLKELAKTETIVSYGISVENLPLNSGTVVVMVVTIK